MVMMRQAARRVDHFREQAARRAAVGLIRFAAEQFGQIVASARHPAMPPMRSGGD